MKNLTVEKLKKLDFQVPSINAEERADSQFSELGITTNMINQESFASIYQPNPFETEQASIKKSFTKKATLKQNVETIIIEERQKEEDEQMKLITQILEIEDFILKNNNMIDFRKNLKKKIILVSLFILVLIAERILYTSLIDQEQSLLETIQTNVGVGQVKEDAHYSEFTNNYFFKFITFGVSFHHSFLLISQFFVTIFVAVSDFVGIKLIFTTLIGIYFIGVLQLFYDGPLPYWTSEMISSPQCVTSSAHPSRVVFTVLYVTFYFLYCLKFRIERNQRKSAEDKKNLFKKIRIIQIIAGVCFIPYFLAIYLSGLAFLFNIGLAFIMFFFYYILMSQSNHIVSEALAKVSINTEAAKQNIFSWFIYLMVMIFFGFVVLLGTNRFVDINWIGNYLNCTRESSTFFLNDQLVGPYHTFSILTVLGGVAGVIFGLNHTYNNLSQSCVKTWYKGRILKRLLRALIVNVCMIPSWVLTVYQDRLLRNTLVVNAGFTEFIIDILHYFFLYLFLFGFVPVYIFQPTKLVHYKKNKKTDRSITILNPSLIY